MARFALLLLPAFALVAAVGGEEPTTIERGKAVFHDTQNREYPACAHCHAVVEEKEEARLPHAGPAGTLYGAAVREGWRNMKTYADVGEASQYCAKTWQKRKGGLEAAPLADLVAYLKSVAPPGPLPMRKVQKTPRLAAEYAGGDPEKGQALAGRMCAGCHNESEEAVSFALQPGKKKAEVIARKVRGYDAKGRFDPTEGTMSYFTNDRLSDEDLGHVVAYLAR